MAVMGGLPLVDAHGGTDIFQGHGAVYSVAWDPQGTRFGSATDTGNITIYDGVTHVLVRSWHAHDGPINQIAFSPDGGRIASVSGVYRNDSFERTLKVWTDTGSLLLNLTGHRDWITSVVWSPDGAYLATASGVDDHLDPTGAYGEVYFWNATVGSLAWNASPLPSYPVRLDWAPDGHRLASLGHLNDLWLLDVKARGMQMINGTYHDPPPGHASHGWAIAWAPDSRLLAGGFSRDIDGDGGTDVGTVVIFDTQDLNGAGQALHVRAGGVHTKPTEWVGWDSTGHFLASCSGLDLIDMTKSPPVQGQDGQVDAGELVVYDNKNSTSILKPVNDYIGGRSWCSSLAWRPGNLAVLGGNADGSLRLYVLDADGDGCFEWNDAAPLDPAICATPSAGLSFFEAWGPYLLLGAVGVAGAAAVAAVVRSRRAEPMPEEALRRRRPRRPSR
jgi:WD40 repeat protein